MNAISESYRIGNDVRLPDWLMKMDLSSGVKLTYSVLATCSGGRDQAWPGQEYLAKRVSVSVRSIQRNLSELVKRGLIAISRESIKGKWRCVYTFLRPGLECEAEKEGDKLSPQSESRANSKADTPPDCRLYGDKLSSSLIKEESIKGKEYTPPTPQTSDQVTELTLEASNPEGVCAEFAKGEEKRPPEDPAWNQVKKRLRSKLGEIIVKTWLDPLKFQLKEQTAILQAPNPFFLKWVKDQYAEILHEAFQSIGCAVRLEIRELTPEEEKLFRQPELAPVAAAAARPTLEEPNLEGLTPKEQYARLYQNYPRNYEGLDDGWKVFSRLQRTEGFPKISELIRAVKRGRDSNPSWQREGGRFVPKIAKWLAGRGWLDLGFAE